MGLASGMVEFSMKRPRQLRGEEGGGNCHEIGNFSGSFDVTNHCDVCLVLCCSAGSGSECFKIQPSTFPA